MQTRIPQNKLIVIIGQTASGKSDLAVELALHFGGEVISADSRQVYRGLDIGTGKITREEMKEVPHHLLDVADPREQFSVAEYQKVALVSIEEIRSRHKLPIICGGTAQYVKSIIDGTVIPDVPPNPKLRNVLTKSTTVELFNKLKDIDPRRASEIEKGNPRRLIRAIEIAETLGSVPPSSVIRNPFSILLIGLNPPKEILRERIKNRLLARLELGMIDEVKHLHDSGLSWQRLDDFGLEYRFVAHYLQGFLTLEEMKKKIETESWHYAGRQMTWWRKDKGVNWLWENKEQEATRLVENFLEAEKGATCLLA